MLYKIANFYAALFANKVFYKWNKLLFHCALRGLGIHNSHTRKRSGEEHFLRSILNQKSNHNLVVFDVGANVGNYSSYIKNINSNTTIYAFEPHPKTFQRLVQSAKEKQFEAFNVGCGESEGKL
ncbi:FkbM family methyltransferase, partial [Bernardetia sp.]|uniref:FkbM family methyltransferase n=1 Tax=Bernardetia sp. TaxID=1937974 RepID=UPI0025B7CB4F